MPDALSADRTCTGCGYTVEECGCTWDDDDTDYEADDPWYPVGCGNPDCIMPGDHYASECHTAEDMEAYHASFDDDA